MKSETEEKIVKAIESIMDKVNGSINSNDALKYTQAALNAANALLGLSHLRK